MGMDYCEACRAESNVAYAACGYVLCARCYRSVMSNAKVVAAGDDYGTRSRVYIESVRAHEEEPFIQGTIRTAKAARLALEGAVAEVVGRLRSEAKPAPDR